MVSYERFLEFVKRSNAISPRITMETATALQVMDNYIFYFCVYLGNLMDYNLIG